MSGCTQDPQTCQHYHAADPLQDDAGDCRFGGHYEPCRYDDEDTRETREDPPHE